MPAHTPRGTLLGRRVPIGGLAVQRTADYRNHFPVGVVLDMGATTTIDGADVSCNTVTGLRTILNHTAQGLRANNLRYIWANNAGPYFHITAEALPDLLESERTNGDVYIALMGMQLKVTATNGTDLFTTFYDNAGVANTIGNALPLAAEAAGLISPHPAILAYHLADDVTSGSRGPKVETMVRAFQQSDPHGRAATAVFTDVDGASLTDLGTDLKLFLTYRYPCGRDANGTDTAEGDFHRSTFAGIGAGDWVDALRAWTTLLSAGSRFWLTLQAHRTSGAGGSVLRYPTDRELRKQFWVAIGEGAQGLFWFTYTDFEIGDGGSPEPMLGARPTALAVAKELSDRLTPKIRRALLDTTRVTTAFTTSGGGRADIPTPYASAYVSDLVRPDGTRYVVLCNHALSTQAVTVSSATLTGLLVSMETRASYRLGVDAISLGALDGTVLRYDPDPAVPQYGQDLSLSVATWWDNHWANAASPAYRAPANTRHHPREVIVAPGGLQAAIDANPDQTTFRLQAGTHPRVAITGRSGLHFIADNPASRPTCRGFEYLGHAKAVQYNGNTAVNPGMDYGLPAYLFTVTAAANTAAGASARDAWFSPPGDLLFKDLDFVSDGSLVYYQFRHYEANGVVQWNTDHWYANAAIAMRLVKGVLIEGCAFSGYKSGADQSVAPPNDPTEVAPISHSGTVWGNMGIENVVIRGCTFTEATNAGGFGAPYSVFFDGARGVVVYGNTITGKHHSGYVLFLTNDDYTKGYRGYNPELRDEMRNARYNVVSTNTITHNGGNTIFGITGMRCLVDANSLSGSGTLTNLVTVSPRCTSQRGQGCIYYENTENVIRNNDLVGYTTITSLVRHLPDDGYGTPCTGATDPCRGRVGASTVTGNQVHAANVTNWVVAKAGETNNAAPTASAESGDVVSGNSKNDSTGVGI